MTPWPQEWLGHSAPARRLLWRGVEAQHRVATMRLVDTLEEQELLEQLLDASKPPLPPEAQASHWLLSTPFRYVSDWPSRFRRPGEPGAWYGADHTHTVAAELAHWRWVFLMDSDGLREGQLVTEHTFFAARMEGRELDISLRPWSEHREQWRHPDDYQPCQQLAGQARQHQPAIQAIRYESARREHALCEVVLDVKALGLTRPLRQQTWISKTTRARVLWSHDEERLQFEMG